MLRPRLPCFDTVPMIKHTILSSLIGRFGDGNDCSMHNQRTIPVCLWCTTTHDENCLILWNWWLCRPEVNIKSWEPQLKDLEEGNGRIKWSDREPYAYWKGNPTVAPTRQDLMKCNFSEGQEWNARVFVQVIIISVFFSLYIVIFCWFSHKTPGKIFCRIGSKNSRKVTSNLT